MSKFRVALSGDFQRPDGSIAYPDFDLGPLNDHPAIEYAFVPVVDNVVVADAVKDFDALILRVTDVSTASKGYITSKTITGGPIGSNKAVVIDPVALPRNP